MVYWINAHRTWIEVADASLYREHVIARSDRTDYLVSRTLVLRAFKPNGGCAEGTVWNIPEHDLDRALATLRKQATDPALEPQPLSPDIEPENKSVPLKSEAAAPTPEATTRKQAAEPALESQPLSSDIEPEPETQPAPLKSEAAESTEVPPCKQTQPKSKPRHNKARPATQLNLLDQIEALNDWS